MASVTIGLVGNPNCGKTTLFNALTGAKQRVGNWPGVTVDRKSGSFEHQSVSVEVVDLPGIYSLISLNDSTSVDTHIACDYILSGEPELLINIVDASNLERHLFLTTQVMEMGVPVILALNMIDVANKRGIKVDIHALAKCLNCPVIALESTKGKGVNELRDVIVDASTEHQAAKPPITFPTEVNVAIDALQQEVSTINPERAHHAYWIALRLLEGDEHIKKLIGSGFESMVTKHQQTIESVRQEETDILIADARYGFVNEVCKKVVKRGGDVRRSFSELLDRVILNRILGIPIFFGVMYLMFLFAINVGGAFQDFFDIASETLFVKGLGHGLQSLHFPMWLTAIIADGAGKGVNTTVTFIPVIGAMFLFLSFLESSGYMARAAFVMDRGMRALGLPGKAFLPMIVGFGCNVPAVMAVRTLESPRDRVLTIMMSPFMSCSARLAIYAVFTSAFFPVGGQNVVFGLYLIGISMAVITGIILRKTLIQSDVSPLVMELPSYHVPTVRRLLQQTWLRLRNFLFRAGKLIVPLCMVLGTLNGITIHGVLSSSAVDQPTLLSMLGQFMTPIFTPMGIQADNWPATVGLVAGVMAKEVVIGTLNTLYAQAGHLFSSTANIIVFDLWHGLREALLTIPQNFTKMAHTLGNPLLTNVPELSLDKGVYGLMYQRFDGQKGAFAYLLFVLLYFPCVSTVAAMTRELNRGWTTFSVLWTTGVAYGIAVAFYQIATFARHPSSSMRWVVGIALVFGITIMIMRGIGHGQKPVALETAEI